MEEEALTEKHENTKQSGNDMLMGSRPGQLNLSNLRLRAVDVEKNIDELLYALRYAPSSLHWNDVVDKMAVLNVQIQQLQDELRPVSHHYAVHPKSVNQQNSVTVPIMLASRLYPEQQELYTTLYSQEVGLGDHHAWKQSVGEMCGLLTGKHGLLDPRGPNRRSLLNRSQKRQQNVQITEEEQDMLNVVGFGGFSTSNNK